MTRKPPVVVILKSTPPPPAPRAAPQERCDYVPRERPNPLNVAARWLGPRLDLRDTGSHRLDGVPASLDSIMQETNRLLIASGAEPIATSERWLPRG